jgi:hypothetical protein
MQTQSLALKYADRKRLSVVNRLESLINARVCNSQPVTTLFAGNMAKRKLFYRA